MKTKFFSSILIFSIFSNCCLADSGIVFIINNDNPTAKISMTEVSDFYYKRKRNWDDGENVRFIDRTSGPLRDFFLQKYLRKSASDIDLFWIGQKLYKGDSAPLRESSDATTVQFVSSLKGAIGYISPSTNLNSKNVKIITIEGAKEE